MLLSLEVTSVVASLLAGWLLGQSVLVMRLRREHKVAVGTGNNISIERAMRAQANTAEYAPMLLILLLLAELQGVTSWLLALLGGSALLGRVLHGLALVWAEPKHKNFLLRIQGMALTWSTLGLLALIVLGRGLGAW
jgi:uncharacterized membrane protein YecN with MAPEG domain